MNNGEWKCADTIGTVLVMVWNYQNADCSLKNWIYCVIYCNFRYNFVPYGFTFLTQPAHTGGSTLHRRRAELKWTPLCERHPSSVEFGACEKCEPSTVMLSIGATTAEKLDGTSCGVDVDPLLFLLYSFVLLWRYLLFYTFIRYTFPLKSTQGICISAISSIPALSWRSLSAHGFLLGWLKLCHAVDDVHLPSVKNRWHQQKWRPVARVGGEQVHLVPKFSEVGWDASHESHRVVARIRLSRILQRWWTRKPSASSSRRSIIQRLIFSGMSPLPGGR